jgi:hypothetical protein
LEIQGNLLENQPFQTTFPILIWNRPPFPESELKKPFYRVFRQLEHQNGKITLLFRTHILHFKAKFDKDPNFKGIKNWKNWKNINP